MKKLPILLMLAAMLLAPGFAFADVGPKPSFYTYLEYRDAAGNNVSFEQFNGGANRSLYVMYGGGPATHPCDTDYYYCGGVSYGEPSWFLVAILDENQGDRYDSLWFAYDNLSNSSSPSPLHFNGSTAWRVVPTYGYPAFVRLYPDKVEVYDGPKPVNLCPLGLVPLALLLGCGIFAIKRGEKR